jgi:hypothetical protein
LWSSAEQLVHGDDASSYKDQLSPDMSGCLDVPVCLLATQVTKFMGIALDFSTSLPYIVPALMERAAPRVTFDVDQNEFVADPERTCHRGVPPAPTG